MDDSSVVDDEPSQLDESPLSPERLGLLAGVTDVPVFAYIGHTVIDDPVFGALVGCFVGAGVALFLPYAMRRGEADTEQRGGTVAGSSEFETPPAEVGNSGRTRGFHRGAAGFALGPAGIVMFGVQIATSDLLLGVLVGPLVAIALYAVLSRALPRE